MLFANLQLATWAFFASVIPLIIVYLLRPKAKEISIPSIMFITQINRKKRKYARIFSRIIKDPLFLIQLLFLISLILAISAPYTIGSREISGGHTIIVLDGSASMQADGRFDYAIDHANGYLTARNSIILAENVPVLALHNGDTGAAKEVLKNIPRTATTSDPYQAIMLASTLLTDGGGSIIVISDFANWDGEDPYVAKKLAEADGIDVSFVSVSGGKNDIAITGGWLSPVADKYKYTCIIKNYMDSDVNAAIEVLYRGERSGYNLAVDAHSSEYFALKDIDAGITEVTLHPDDDLVVDNHAYIVVPVRQTRKILYISDYENVPSATVMKLLPLVDAVFRKQEEVKSIIRNYDCVVVGLCNESLQSSLCDNLADYAAAGGSVVMMAQDGLLRSDTGRLLPISVSAEANETALDEVRESVMTRDIDLSDIAIGHYLRGDAKRGSVTYISAEDNTPILSFWRIGGGKVVYFGISDIRGDDAWSDFHTKPEYPIFWLNLIDYLCGEGDIENCNMQTGSTLRFDSRIRITAPDGRVIRTNNLLLDQTGVYRLPDRLIAVNLYNPKESNLVDSGIVVSEKPKIKETTIKTTVKKKFDWILLIIALVLIFTELYYIRSRGEL
ncbi:MAG: BatA and WFA domain-containing protein [Euryarchaeota archaeon]|nr:BatA and WFA domain-containing protein [Euryarchaeota archaeon]